MARRARDDADGIARGRGEAWRWCVCNETSGPSTSGPRDSALTMSEPARAVRDETSARRAPLSRDGSKTSASVRGDGSNIGSAERCAAERRPPIWTTTRRTGQPRSLSPRGNFPSIRSAWARDTRRCARSSLVPRRRRRRQPEPIAHPALPTLALTAPASPHPRLIAGEHAARDPSHGPRARARRGAAGGEFERAQPHAPRRDPRDAPVSPLPSRWTSSRGRLRRRRRRRRGHPTKSRSRPSRGPNRGPRRDKPRPVQERRPRRQHFRVPRSTGTPVRDAFERERPLNPRRRRRRFHHRRRPTPSRSPRNRRRRSPRNRRRRRTRPRPPSRISRRRRPRTRVRRRIRRPSPTHRRRNPRNLPRRPRRRRTFCAKTAGTSPR